jgi:molybdate transport repressor ModE-like protein
MISEEKPLVGSKPLMSSSSKAKPSFKIWLETEEGYVFGPGVYSLLKKISETGTLKGAAETLGMSYRFAWGLLKKAEERLGEPLVESHKGGRSGGGGFEITDVGRRFLREFSEMERVMKRLSEEAESLEKPKFVTSIEAEVIEVKQRGDRVVITLQVEESTNLRLELNKKIESLDIAPGDRMSLEIALSPGI